MEIKNLKKAAERIKKAIKSKENIILYGDADLDGSTSVIILKESIKTLGGQVACVYFPDRELEGYGITQMALEKLAKYKPALFIALDCGIANLKEVKMAKDMGFEVLIIDHHEVLDKLPSADIIVDPKQKGDKYPFKNLATAGLAFKLAELLLAKKLTDSLRGNFLELAALATLADMMPLQEDNEKIVKEGLPYLETSWRPGLRVLMDLEQIKDLGLREKVSKIISFLNVRESENGAPACFTILTMGDKDEAKEFAEKLFEKSIERKQAVKSIVEQVRSKNDFNNPSSIIFEGNPNWELTLLGIAASIILSEYQRPIFLFKQNSQESHGSCRGPSGVNLVEAMKTCSEYLETYGGHPPAGGFRIKNENLEMFKKCLTDYFENQVHKKDNLGNGIDKVV